MEDGGDGPGLDPTLASEGGADREPDPEPSTSEDRMWRAIEIDNLANVQTTSGLMGYSDVDNTGNGKLVIVDCDNTEPSRKQTAELKVWKGTMLIQKRQLLGIPCGITTFHMDESEGGCAATAVACDDAVYIYVNLKAYAKFIVPPVPLNEEEESLWNQALADGVANVDPDVLHASLLNIRDYNGDLSPRSFKLISLPKEQRAAFVAKYCAVPLKRKTNITAIDVLYKSATSPGQPQCLVITTEIGEVLVLSPKNFSVLEKFQLPAAAVHISCQGVYDVEYRLMLACRDGNLYRVKGKSATPIGIELPAHAVGLFRINKNIYVGCMNETLSCYSAKGKRQWTITLPASITTMALLSYRPRNLKAVVVALSNGEVRFYNDRALVSSFTLDEPVVGMVFGRYGADVGVLSLATKSGRLHFRYLSHRVDFSLLASMGGPPLEQNIKIPVPPKSQLYIDQTKRERDNAMTMHHTFQRDLFRLKHTTARNYVKALQDNLTPIVNSVAVSLRINTEVQGFGPTFKVIVTLINTTAKPVTSLSLTFTSLGDSQIYKIETPLLRAAMLIPGTPYLFSTKVKCLTEELESSPITIIVSKPTDTAPLLSSAIDMPVVSSIAM